MSIYDSPMAILAPRAGMEFRVEDKIVHPFFEKRLKTQSGSTHDKDAATPQANQNVSIQSKDESPVGRGRRPKSSAKGKSPAPTATNITIVSPSIQSKLHTDPQLLDIDPNHGRRKRVKSLSPEAAQSRVVAESEALNLDQPDIKNCAQKAANANKMLRLNPRTGTIGSPPVKKAAKASPGVGVGGVSAKTAKHAQCLVVTMRYGLDNERRCWLGQKIDDISNGVKFLPPTSKPPRVDLARTGKSSKSTHPFFSGKKSLRASTPCAERENVEGDIEALKRSPRKKSMTLGEARTHSPRKKTAKDMNSSAFRNFGKIVNIIKYPGAVEPCWPPKGMGHIRGLDEIVSYPQEMSHHIPFLEERKSKYASMEIPGAEDILITVANKLGIGHVLEILNGTDGDEFPEPERCLRVPKKHFESGLQVQRRVRREIVAHLPSSHAKDENSPPSEDELQVEDLSCSRVHAALLKIYRLIPNQLTAFDRSEYEIQSWVTKYAPYTANDVLQCGKEAFILKDWLQALMVVSVDRGATESDQSRAGSAVPRKSTTTSEKPRRKKRKSDHLRGFVVSTDDDIDELDEVSDPETDFSMHEGSRLPSKTVLRSRDIRNLRDARKVRNAVVISGPSGCGKTAMVYAVAKELCFEVFEINSSSRRSGKEIMERVGDMTRNHLVQHSHDPNISGFQSQDIEIVSDALEAELKSGRQGTMNSFFKPKKTTDSISKASKLSKASKKPYEDITERRLKLSPKKQKQSLILLEEVDVLFEEDKQFWTTVMNLIAQSKRPVIMTCNDETVVPLQNLHLHAIIRPTPPPLDIATDYMLLVAAAEGHIIQRKAVKALYESRGHDLRASMAELDYWCQLGVGDCKGGLDWFYPRWPPGCDVDEHGNTIRVMSEGTYKASMGWLGRDSTFERPNDPQVKQDVLRQVWDGWSIDADMHNLSLDAASVYSDVSSQNGLSCMDSYEDFVAAMSLADICAAGSLAAGNQILLDKTSPPVSAKSRDDFVIGYELLEADPLNSFDSLHRNIAIWIQSQAEDLLQQRNPVKRQPLFESQLTTLIANAGSKQANSVTRKDFSMAFDPIAEPEKNSLHSGSSLDYSVFDRTMSIIAEDVAPYVRSIVAYDAKLQTERTRLSNLLSEGGRKGKRLRTTRSALSALEGGPRKNTRPEKYFRVPLNAHLVRSTGMQCWEDAVASEMQMRNGNVHIKQDESEDVSGMTDSSHDQL